MIRQRAIRVCLAAVAITLATTATRAQFGTVINIPPDPNIPDHGAIGSGTQLNLKAGGMVGISFEAGAPDGSSTNVEVNIQGGSLGREYHANGGSVTNVSGGSIGIDLDANTGSIVNFTGGVVGGGLDAFAGSTVNIAGGTHGAAMESFGADVNISGGTVGNDFRIYTDSLVNISGGRVGFFMHAGALDQSSSNVIVNVTGGVVEGGVEVNKGATFTATGGLIALGFSTFGIDFNPFGLGIIQGSTIDYDFDTFADSDVRLFGSDFYLDDMPVAAAGQKITIPAGSVLSGVLADGTPIMLSDKLQDDTAPQTISLHTGAPPAIGQMDYVLPTDVAPPSIRGPQTLTLNGGGTVGNFFRAGRGSTVTINGGQMGRGFEVAGTTVNISGGQVGDEFEAHEESVVNLSGGRIGAFFEAGRGSVVAITGGFLSIGAQAGSGSEVNVSGGMIGSFFSANAGSEVNVSGGSFGNSFGANSGSAVTLKGGEFRLDGVAIAGLGTVGNTVPFNLPTGSVLSGTLEDGTPIAFSSAAEDFISNGTLTLQAAALPAIGPALISVPGATAPLGIRQGQTLAVGPGGTVGQSGASFNAGTGSTVSVTGGEISSSIRAVDATINVSGGTVRGIQAFHGSDVHIGGAASAFAVDAYAGSDVTVTGGTVSGFETFSGSTVTIQGGTFLGSGSQRAVQASTGSEVNVSGGNFNGRFGVFGGVANVSGGNFDVFEASGTGTEVHLFGAHFLLDGVELSDLELDEALTITDRNVNLSGVLANGDAFSFELNTASAFGSDFVFSNVLLTVTRVDAELLAGDFNNDGKVDAADYTVWRNRLNTSEPLPNETTSLGTVDQQDYAAWKMNFGASAAGSGAKGNAAVPEPGMVGLVAIAWGWVGILRRQRQLVKRPR